MNIYLRQRLRRDGDRKGLPRGRHLTAGLFTFQRCCVNAPGPGGAPPVWDFRKESQCWPSSAIMRTCCSLRLKLTSSRAKYNGGRSSLIGRLRRSTAALRFAKWRARDLSREFQCQAAHGRLSPWAKGAHGRMLQRGGRAGDPARRAQASAASSLGPAGPVSRSSRRPEPWLKGCHQRLYAEVGTEPTQPLNGRRGVKVGSLRARLEEAILQLLGQCLGVPRLRPDQLGALAELSGKGRRPYR